MCFAEECGEADPLQCAEALELISRRIKSVYGADEIRKEKVDLAGLLTETCDEALSAMGKRDLEITRDFGEGLAIHIDRGILKKVFGGLLKNAIENTPDQGRIEVTATVEEGVINVLFRDYGVGISPQNQKLIFQGFFHTQDTMDYTSGKPYAFNAGGTGCDLLRAKVFSERYRFSLDFESTRCRFIPEDTDLCPGKISDCPFITDKSECTPSGSVFSVRFAAAAGIHAM